MSINNPHEKKKYRYHEIRSKKRIKVKTLLQNMPHTIPPTCPSQALSPPSPITSKPMPFDFPATLCIFDPRPV